MKDYFDKDKRKPLPPDKLRSYTGFEHCTDDEVPKCIDSIEKLARILLSFHKEMENIGAFDKDGNLNEDHHELIRRREALLGNPKTLKKQIRKQKRS
ncbi:MAG: hypothetical protein V4547_13850 [Bacteroidota bacterium]